jgi:hypothetical protein
MGPVKTVRKFPPSPNPNIVRDISADVAAEAGVLGWRRTPFGFPVVPDV